ncbi:MAG: hypothetical protein WCI73_09700, partial [Phycisphaerae bacterium]
RHIPVVAISADALADSVAKIQPGGGIKAEDVAKLVSDQLAARAAADTKAGADAAVIAAARDKVIAAQLKGVPASFLKLLPETADETVLTAAAAAIRKDVESIPGVKLPDVGGVAKDGGTVATSAAQAPPKYTPANTGLSEGMAKYASSIELPK